MRGLLDWGRAIEQRESTERGTESMFSLPAAGAKRSRSE